MKEREYTPKIVGVSGPWKQWTPNNFGFEDKESMPGPKACVFPVKAEQQQENELSPGAPRK